MLKYKWKVAPAPTGRYKSFEKRQWPVAEVVSGHLIALVLCEDDYRPRNVKSGNHKPLGLRIRMRGTDTNHRAFTWGRFPRTFATLPELKEFLKDWIERHPDHDFAIEE